MFREKSYTDRLADQTKHSEEIKQDKHNSEEYSRLDMIAEELARKLTLNADFITLENVEGNKISTYAGDWLFPNADNVITPENGYVRLSIYENNLPYSSNVSLKTKEIGIHDIAKSKRIDQYFYEDIKSFDKEEKLNTFIAYLKQNKKSISYEGLYNHQGLTAENLKNIITELKSEDYRFDSLDLFMKHPTAYSPEHADEILTSQWLKGSIYNFEYIPSHMGMEEENVNFRKALDKAYKQISGKSIYDFDNNGLNYFDKLYSKNRYDELMAEHHDKFLERIKEKGDLNKLVSILELDESKKLKDSISNKNILNILNEITTKENEENIFSTNDKEKLSAYLVHKILNNQFKDTNLIKDAIIRYDNKYKLLDKSFENKDKLDKNMLKLLYQSAWLYNKGSKSPDELKSEYRALFSEKIENVKETWGDEYPIGSTRLDILIKDNDYQTIAKYNVDEFLNLPLEISNKILRASRIRPVDNFNVIEEDKNIFNMLNKFIDKKGLQAYIDGAKDNLYINDFLACRYMSGIRSAEEMQRLRDGGLNRNTVLEAAFSKENNTLYQLKDIPNLISSGDTDKIAIILKDGYKFRDDKEKYNLFNELINEACASENWIEDEYNIYLQDLIKVGHIDFKKAEKYEAFSSECMLNFAINNYGTNPVVTKEYLNHIVDKSRKDQNISPSNKTRLERLGYSLKTDFAYNLIRYSRKTKNIDVDLKGKDLSKFDFEAKFYQDRYYQPSSGSHTTFLNEMLQYWHAEDAAIALNNGASPFTKAGFFSDKFEAMPFNMMFGKALKNNRTEELQEFMTTIAKNLNEDKKSVMKDIWTSLGQKLKEDSRVKKIMSETNNVLNTRNFAQENRNKEETLRKIEEERARQAEERRKVEEKKQRDNAIYELKQEAVNSLDNIMNLDEKAIAEGLANYLKENKDNLKALPNKEELNSFKEAALRKKEQEIENKKQRDEIKKREINEIVTNVIKVRESESSSILSAKEVGELIQEQFKEDTEAKPFILETIKTFQTKAKEKLEQQEKLTNIEKIAADKLIEFFENDDTHGFYYFSNVGKDKRTLGYDIVTKNVMQELGVEMPEGNLYPASEETLDLFYVIKANVEKLETEARDQSYFDEEQEVWVDNQYDFLADKAGYNKAVSEEKQIVNDKEAIKAAKKAAKQNNKGGTVISNLAGLAALKDKFNTGK